MRKPLVIAHRGASGYLPEHTAEAKVMAHAQGADYLEQDVVATRDGVPVVLHDLYLDRISNVATRFPRRARSDGHYYVVDFDAAEIASLEVLERSREDSSEARYPARFPRGEGRFRVSTLAEELELITGLNRSTGRRAGVYPEIKDPRWHAAHGIDLADLLLTALAAHGLTQRDSAVFVQCFDAAELRRLRGELGTRLKLVQLLTHDDDLSPRALAEIASYADGIGMPFLRLVDVDAGVMRPARLCRDAQAQGLAVHPYTFRKEDVPAFARSFEALLSFFFEEIGVDGLFCDYPDVAVGVRHALSLD